MHISPCISHLSIYIYICCKLNWNLLRTREGNRRLRTSTTTNYYYKGEEKK
ncbi:hypothetical protein Scep_024021 [Stephania cephalantha]|uniref:Uncharacterized protein n=1 Tax=Stephania cephalantha TaxID=152367 RepID=A0AAP0HXV8_9MAGN